MHLLVTVVELTRLAYYNAGWGVVGQYTGIIFTAMATDYFPRLSAIHADDDKVKETCKTAR